MKKILSLVLSFVLVLSLAIPAFADVLWEPNNRFYEKHANQCQLLQRSFYVNGDEGYVNLLAAPDSSTVNFQLENGGKVYVYWQYLDWGYVEVDNDDGGWVELGQLELIYDHISFADEYSHSIMPYDPALCQPLLDSWDSGTLMLWPYPGAEEAKFVWESADEAMAQLKEHGGDYFHQIFRDGEGLIWGFCGYLWGNRNFWVCLNAPAGREDELAQSGQIELPVREVKQPELIPAAEPEPPTASYLLPAILVIVVVALTATCLFLLRKKRKTKQ